MRSALVVLLLLASAAAAAQPTVTLVDLERTKTLLYASPRYLTPVDGRLMAFIAGPQMGRHHANQLWISDGTFAGTRATGIDDVRQLAAAGSKLFYTTDEQRKLWRYDFDAGASTLLHESAIAHSLFTSVGGTAYFIHAGQLWRSEGTVGGTAPVTTFPSGREPAFGYPPLVVGNTIYFWARSSFALPNELWRTDGTAAGTQLIANVSGTAASSTNHLELCEAAGIVYFVVRYEREGNGLWRTDGTSGGTRRVAENLKLDIIGVASLGNRVVFNAWSQDLVSLWTTDGTDAGTIRLGVSSQQPVVVTSNGVGVFTAYERPTPSTSTFTLWRTDGTPAGTYSINEPFTRDVSRLTAAGSSVFFVLDDDLYRSDGKRGGTVLILDPSQAPDWITPMGDRLFFTAAQPPDFGRSLWVTGGSSNAATRLSDPVYGTLGSNPSSFVPVRGGALFSARTSGDYGGNSIWRTDGTIAGTVPLGEIKFFGPMTACGDRVLSFESQKVYGTDGTIAGTRELSSTYFPQLLACVDGVAYFGSSGFGASDDLWRTDATIEGTVRARAGKPGDFLRWRAGDAVRGNALLLAQGTTGIELWLSDGTSPGTTLLRGSLDTWLVPGSTRVSNDLLYFVTGERAFQHLWRSDGTPAGTFTLVDNGPVSILTDFDGLLLIEWSGDGTPSHPAGIYSTDGRAGAIQLLRETPATGARTAAMFGHHAWISGFPLIRTDGTPAGTVEDSTFRSTVLFGSSSWLFGQRANEPVAYDGFTVSVPDVDIHWGSMFEANGRVLASGGLPETGDELLIIEQPFSAAEIEPAAGTTAGGERVTIRGKGFVAPVDVFFDGVRATVLDVANDAIAVTTPPGGFGAADVRIENGDGRVSRKPRGFQYRCLEAVATAETTQAACPNVPVRLHGEGGVRCTWAPSDGLDDPASCNPIATAFETMTYTLVAHDAAECTASTRVTVARAPAVAPQLETPLFAGVASLAASVSNAPPGATFAWSIEHGRIIGSSSAKSITFVGDCGSAPVVLQTTVTTFGCSLATTVSVPRSIHPTITKMDPPRGNIGTSVTLTGDDLACTTEILFGEIPAGASVDGASVRVRVPPGVTRDLLRVRTSTNPSVTTRTNASFIVRGRTDFNRDGYADIVWREESGRITAWRMNGASVAEVTSLPPVEAQMKILGVGDFDGDGFPDLVVLDPRVAALLIGRSNRPDEPLERLNDAIDGLDFAGIGDFDDDGRADILWRAAGGKLAIDFVRDGRRVERATLDGPARGGWTIAAIDDFDGDGKSDILWHNARTDGLVMWLMNGATFGRAAPVRHSATTGLSIATTNDFDGDGRADIVWHRDTGAAMLWTMNGETIRSSAIIGADAEPDWRIVGSGDFDHNARADLLQQHSRGALRLWLMNGATLMSSSPIEKSTAALTLVSPLR